MPHSHISDVRVEQILELVSIASGNSVDELELIPHPLVVFVRVIRVLRNDDLVPGAVQLQPIFDLLRKL